MKKFVTLFPQTMNYHLTKDVGMIPYMLGNSKFGYETELVTYYIDNYFYLEKEVAGLHLTELKNFTGNEFIDSLIYIWKNANNIDVLHLFHWGRKTLMRIIVYKLRNRKGIAYVKLDIDSNGYDILQKDSRSRYFFKKILNKADIISAESTYMQKKLCNKFGADIKYLPNGYFHFSNEEMVEKKKNILTVGRIGTEQKSSKELVEGFAQFWNNHKDWKLVLVGTVEKDFIAWYSNYIKDYNDIENCIEIVGEITDKAILENFYKKASIFALPSRWESFGLVLVEAMSFGCSLLTTQKVASAKDILNDNCVMISSENASNIADGLTTLVDRIGISEQIAQQNIEYVQAKFDWVKLIKRLSAMLDNID